MCSFRRFFLCVSLFALSIALIIPCGILASRSALLAMGSTAQPNASLAASLLMAWNPYVLSIGRLNANLLVLPLALLLIHLLLERETPIPVTGLLFGAVAAVRNEAICFVPAICFWLLLARHPGQDGLRQRVRRLVTLGLWTLAAMAPVFYWKWYAFGHPLMHPSQYPHFQGFRPEFLHQILGLEFGFNGLFNWPLHDQLVRTPHFGYPTYLLFPLVTLRCLGAVAGAFVLLGLVRLGAARPRLGLFLVVWMVPVYLLFGPQENWEEVKMTFMLLAWPPLVPLLAVGLASVSHRPWSPRVLAGLMAAVIALMGLGRLLASVEVPEDQRWYVRFPKADPEHPGAQAGLSEQERSDWIYFQSFETPAEIERERDKLRSIWPWPGSYLPIVVDPGQAWTEIRDESGQRTLEVLEVWGYIYGSRS